MNARVEFGQDQQPGLKNKEFEQTDGVFFKEINNVIGKTGLKIGMVIDLIQSPNLGMVPSDVFENTIQIIESQPQKNIPAALGEVKSRIIQFLNTETLGDSISFSLVAIENSSLHTVSLGNRTRVYLYNNSKVRDISSNLELAPKDVVEVNDGYLQVALTKGDKIVLCTDGLFTMLQNQEELDIIGRYDKPSFGAKHLNSLAKGRNVEDSVTTGVINYGSSASPKKPQFFIPAGVILLAIVLFLIFPKQETPLPEDLGVAIVTSGKVFAQDNLGEFSIAIESLGIVDPGTFLVVQNGEPAEIKLKTRTETFNSTQNISGVTLFASESTIFNIRNINYANVVNGKTSAADLLNQTTIELVSGKIILINEFSPRVYHIIFSKDNSDWSSTLTLTPVKVPSGIAAIRNGDEIQLFCLSGSCTLTFEDELVEIQENSKVSINGLEKIKDTLTTLSISQQDLSDWNDITDGYLYAVFLDYLPK
jgi:hypothetical protein